MFGAQHTLGSDIFLMAQPPNKICTIVILILQVKKPRHREGELLTQGHPAEGVA